MDESNVKLQLSIQSIEASPIAKTNQLDVPKLVSNYGKKIPYSSNLLTVPHESKRDTRGGEEKEKMVKKVFCMDSMKYSKIPKYYMNDSEYEGYGDQDYSDLERFESGEFDQHTGKHPNLVDDQAQFGKMLRTKTSKNIFYLRFRLISVAVQPFDIFMYYRNTISEKIAVLSEINVFEQFEYLMLHRKG